MNKKVFIMIMTCLLLWVLPKESFAATETPDINLEVNDVSLIGSEPMYMENGNALVYYRFFFESLGMTVDLDNSIGRIFVYSSEGSDSKPLFTLWLGSKRVLYQDKEVTLPAPVRRIGNLTYMPVRSISELLGYQVEFIADEQSIRLTKQIPGEDTKVRPLFDNFCKGGLLDPPRGIFTERGWNIYTNLESLMGTEFNFLPLNTSAFSIADINFISDNKALVKATYESLSAAFTREIDFIFSVTKEKQDWKVSHLYLEGPRYKLAEGARATGTLITTQQANDVSAVISGLDDYYQAWADGDAAAIIRSTSPAYISEYEMSTGLRYVDEVTSTAYTSEKQKVAETFLPYLSDAHAVIYVAELHEEWDDDGHMVEVPVDVLFRMDKTSDGRWTVHSRLELVDMDMVITLQ